MITERDDFGLGLSYIPEPDDKEFVAMVRREIAEAEARVAEILFDLGYHRIKSKRNKPAPHPGGHRFKGGCKGCGCPMDHFTKGCKNCSTRHSVRRWLLRQRA